tara:strand:- start:10438 stop:11337 length:900 start_codon:yes stop_codon:yes gene_type:complete
MILILGVNGFLGRQISKQMIDHNIQVVGLGTRELPAVSRLFDYIQADINDDCIPSILMNYKFDTIIDCITYVAPNHESNCEKQITKSLLKYRYLLNEFYVHTKYIFISSGGTVYGNSKTQLTECSPTNPISAYGKQKLIQENMILDSCKKAYYILRLANPFGGDQTVVNGVGFVSKVIECAENGEMLDLYVPSSTIRDYIFIEDVTQYISDFYFNNYKSGIYNLSTGVGTSLADVIKKVEKIWDRSIKLNEFHTEPQDFVYVNLLANRKLKSETNREIRYSLDDGLNYMFNAHKGINYD